MNEDFNKGVDNGVDQVEKAHYEDYVSSDVTLQWLQESRQQLEEQLAEIKLQIQENRQERTSLAESEQVIKHRYNAQLEKVRVLEQEISFHEKKVEDAQSEKKLNPLHYPLLAGIIYLIAGSVFLLGDLIISHEIVAYALNIRNTNEAWAFACGLAGITLLLKPAYERLIEEPYLKNRTAKNQRIHNYFQTALVVIAVSTLTVLGWFRYEAYKVDKLKEGINAEIKSLQLAATPLIQGAENTVAPDVSEQIKERMTAVASLNKELVSSPWALLSFVLSGVLFAIAGAICFGMAFPILSSYWKRWFWHNPTIRRSQRKIRKIQNQLLEDKATLLENTSLLELYQRKWEMLPDQTELTQRLLRCEEQSLQLAEKTKLAMEASRISQYNIGYSAGTKHREGMSPEDHQSHTAAHLERLNTREEKAPRVLRSNGLRPYQALRKAIADSFNEN